MKRADLLRHLDAEGCNFLREAGSHTVYVNRKERAATTIPRHREIDERLVRKICRDLKVREP
ncbi:MAG: type II toxin-antitoxin system HicA family toxin [Deltaproteobacteria bacterium]|nr:type II toxin-antitoxin system HicA family toxin [Deltaproteobacteria bacterium]